MEILKIGIYFSGMSEPERKIEVRQPSETELLRDGMEKAFPKTETPEVSRTENVPGLTPEGIEMAKFFSNLNPGQFEIFKNLLNTIPANTKDVERERNIGRIGLAAIEHDFAGSPKNPDGSVDLERMEAEVQMNQSNSLTKRGPMETAGRAADQAGRFIAEKVGDWYPTSAFGRLGTKLQVYGIELLSAPKAAVLEGMHRWRKERAVAADIEVKKIEAQITAHQESIDKINKSAETIRSGGSGFFDATVAAKIERDRHTQLNNIRDAKGRLQAAQTIYEYRHNKAVFWENKGNNLAE